MTQDSSAAPGWDAIDRTLDALHGREPDAHFGTMIKWRLGGPDPLDGISAYKVLEGDAPHWHLVTYGFSELYGKEEGTPKDVSGYGFELTVRLACPADAEQPPPWVLGLLQNIARYVFETGNTFDVGHHLDTNGPISSDEPTQLAALLFTEDSALPDLVSSPNGSIRFIQVVGITLGELDAVQAWNSASVVALLRERSPLLLTDLARSSAADDPAFVAAVTEGAKRDGSSQGSLAVPRLTWRLEGERFELTIGALLARNFGEYLRGRLPFGNPFYLLGPEHFVFFEPGDEVRRTEREGHPVIVLDPGALDELADAIVAERGTYTVPSIPWLTVIVEATEITDRQTGEVLETIG